MSRDGNNKGNGSNCGEGTKQRLAPTKYRGKAQNCFCVATRCPHLSLAETEWNKTML